MKTKSFLFSVLFLAAILVGCERPQQQTEGEANSYITVSVKSSMLSRAATDGDYIDGNATIADIVNILANGTISVIDRATADELKEIRKDLY